MLNANELREKCIGYMGKKGITYDAFAKKLKMSRSTINVFVRGGDVSDSTLLKLHAFFTERESVKPVPLSSVPEMQPTDIGYAIRMLKKGKNVKRNNWDNKYISIKETVIDGQFEIRNVLYMIIEEKYAIPWTPQPTDMFATNWEVIE